MKNYLITILFIFCLSHPYSANAEQKFFDLARDVPLMEGLEEIKSETISFDKPDGRIIESIALINNIAKLDIINFYEASLPQFGWSKVDNNKFFRKNELLEISFHEISGNKIIKVMINPTL